MKPYALFTLLLLGCTSKPTPTPVPIQNDEKTNYIKRVESVVSDSASALVATSPTLPQGVPKQLIDNAAERLSGVSKPSVDKIRDYERMLKENDSKAAKKDGEAAKKIEAEVTEQRRRADEAESALVLQELINAQAQEERDAAFKEKTLWQFSTTGLGVFVLGLLATAFTPFKKEGFVLIAGGMLAMGSLWIFDSDWFIWVVGSAFALVATSVVFVVLRSVINKFNKARDADTGVDNKKSTAKEER